jgi:D-arabinose 1-dehydrogenase-like Zn-dependent alcohol dehydrogenase
VSVVIFSLVKRTVANSVFSLIPLMDTLSSIYPLSVTSEPAQVSTLGLGLKGIRIQGSLVASRHSIRNLLEFAAKKNIVPTIMTFPLTADGIEEAMKTLRDGKMRYRGVLVRKE